jgi:hypothetical protein
MTAESVLALILLCFVPFIAVTGWRAVRRWRGDGE